MFSGAEDEYFDRLLHHTTFLLKNFANIVIQNSVETKI